MIDPIGKAYDSSHSIWKLFEKLTAEEIAALGNVIQAVGIGGAQSAAYYDGLFAGINWVKEDICPTCHVKHTDDDREPFKDAFVEQFTKMFGAEATQKLKEVQKTTTAPSADARPGTYL